MPSKQELAKKHKELDAVLSTQKTRVRGNRSDILDLREKYRHLCVVLETHRVQIQELRLAELKRKREEQREQEQQQQQKSFSQRMFDLLFCR